MRRGGNRLRREATETTIRLSTTALIEGGLVSFHSRRHVDRRPTAPRRGRSWGTSYGCTRDNHLILKHKGSALVSRQVSMRRSQVTTSRVRSRPAATGDLPCPFDPRFLFTVRFGNIPWRLPWEAFRLHCSS